MDARRQCQGIGPRSLVCEVLRLHECFRPVGCLSGNLGDGVLCSTNPVFSGVREAALKRGFRFSDRTIKVYSGWPLVALDQVLSHRVIPYQDNRAGLKHLEDSRPRFFRLADLSLNRPSPNFVLHEAAHAVAYHELFGATNRAAHAMKACPEPTAVLVAEAFAMTSEYFAACALSTPIESWFFSINSYRHRTPGKKVLGETLRECGPEVTCSSVLLAFVFANFLKESISVKALERGLDMLTVTRPTRPRLLSLARSLRTLMPMNPEFLRDTTRLFLCSLGHPKTIIPRLEGTDPLAALESNERVLSAWPRLIAALGL